MVKLKKGKLTKVLLAAFLIFGLFNIEASDKVYANETETETNSVEVTEAEVSSAEETKTEETKTAEPSAAPSTRALTFDPIGVAEGDDGYGYIRVASTTDTYYDEKIYQYWYQQWDAGYGVLYYVDQNNKWLYSTGDATGRALGRPAANTDAARVFAPVVMLGDLEGDIINMQTGDGSGGSTILLTSTGQLWYTGDGGAPLGSTAAFPSEDDRFVKFPQSVMQQFDGKVVDIHFGGDATFYLTDKGTLYTYDSDARALFGTTMTNNVFGKTPDPDGSGIKKIWGDKLHRGGSLDWIIALTNNGNLYGAGNGDDSRAFGTNGSTNGWHRVTQNVNGVEAPIPTGSVLDVADYVTDTTYILKNDGSVWAAGTSSGFPVTGHLQNVGTTGYKRMDQWGNNVIQIYPGDVTALVKRNFDGDEQMWYVGENYRDLGTTAYGSCTEGGPAVCNSREIMWTNDPANPFHSTNWNKTEIVEYVYSIGGYDNTITIDQDGLLRAGGYTSTYNTMAYRAQGIFPPVRPESTIRTVENNPTTTDNNLSTTLSANNVSSARVQGEYKLYDTIYLAKPAVVFENGSGTIFGTEEIQGNVNPHSMTIGPKRGDKFTFESDPVNMIQHDVYMDYVIWYADPETGERTTKTNVSGVNHNLNNGTVDIDLQGLFDTYGYNTFSVEMLRHTTNNDGEYYVSERVYVPFQFTREPVIVVDPLVKEVTKDSTLPHKFDEGVKALFGPYEEITEKIFISDYAPKNDAFTEVTATIDGVSRVENYTINTVDETTAGVYTVTYSVDVDVEGSNFKVNEKGTIVVNDGTLSVGDDYIIKADDYLMSYTNFSDTDEDIIKAAKLKLWKKNAAGIFEETTDVSGITVDKTGWVKTEGLSVPIKFSIDKVDGSGVDASRTVTGKVDNKPTITFTADTLALGTAGASLVAEVTASDIEDGAITNITTEPADSNAFVSGKVYPVTYTVTDSHGNVTTAVRAAFIDDGVVKQVGDYLVIANDYTVRASQVDNSDDAIITASDFEVYDKEGKAVDYKSLPGFDINPGTYASGVGAGDYTVTFNLTATDSTTITVTVESGGAPVLTVDPKFVELALGTGTYDVMTNVSATDEEDGTLTSSITSTIKLDGNVVTSVDKSKTGVYVIEYTVSDNDGNTATEKRVVLVNDGTITVGDTYLIQASNWAEHVNEVIPGADLKASKYGNVTVFEKASGEKNTTVTVSVNDGGYTNVAADYPVTFSVVGDATAVRNVTGVVYDGVRVGNVIIDADSFEVFTEVAQTINASNLHTHTNISAKEVTPAAVNNITSDVELTTASVASLANVTAGKIGVHPLTYTVTKGEDTAEITVYGVVKGKDTVINNNILLDASDAVMNVSDVTGSSDLEGDIIDRANVIAQVTTSAEVITDLGADTTNVTAKPGIYDSSITATHDGKTATKAIKVVVLPDGVTLGEEPYIYADPVVIDVGGTYSTDAHNAFAYDLKDGDLTDKLNVTQSVKTTESGVYYVTFDVEDSDNNKTEKITYVVVNDPENPYVFGDTYFIKATDFTKTVNEVTDTSDDAIKTAAQLEIYDIETGQPATPDVTVDNGGYTQAAGAYDLGFTVTSDAKATTTAVGTVEAGAAPKILGTDFAEVDLNATFNPMTGVTATDAEDGTITGDIVVTGTVDTATAGFQTITYEVTDSDLNKVTEERVVLVNDGTYGVGDTYVIQASNWAEHVTEVIPGADLKAPKYGNVSVFDKATGVKNTTVTVLVNDGGYTNVVAEYDVVFRVSGDDLATRNATGVVYDGVRVGNLIIDADSFEVFTEVAQTINASNLHTHTNIDAKEIKPTEVVDITSDVSLTTASVASLANVTAGNIGVHPLTYTVTKGADTAEITVYGVVKGKDTVINNNILLDASDAVMSVSDVTGSSDLEGDIIDRANVIAQVTTSAEVITDLSADTTNVTATPGIYDSSITATHDGKTATKAIKVVVLPDGVTLGEEPYIYAEPVTINMNHTYTTDLHKAFAYDLKDGDLTDKLNVTQSVDTSTSAIYYVTFDVEDSDNNKTEETTYVVVNDPDNPYVFGDDYIIKATDYSKSVSEVTDTSDDAIKTAAQLEIYDIETGQPATPDVTVDNGGYTQAAGVYDLGFTVTSDAKATTTAVATITAGAAPKLSGVEFAEVDLDSTFDPMNGVSASDDEDGDITGDVVVTGTVDTSVAGLQKITYEVTDSDLNSTSEERVVLVNDGTFEVGYNFVIQASNWAEHVNDVVPGADLKDATHGNVKVFDKKTAEENTTLTVTVEDGGYTNAVGEYDVVFSVVGDDLASKSVVGLVYDGVRVGNVVINANGFEVFTDEAMTINDSNLHTYTNVNAKEIKPASLVDITSDVELTTASVASLANVTAGKVGVHALTYSITKGVDTAEITVYGVVKDEDTVIKDGILLDADNVVMNVTDVGNSSDIEKDVIDNANVIAQVIDTAEVITDLGADVATVVAKPGIYDSTITATHDGKTATKPIKVAVLPDGVTLGEEPYIYAEPVVIDMNDSYSTDAHNAFAYDLKDGDLTDKLNVTADVDTSTSGIYYVTFDVEDSDGNKTEETTYVVVNDPDNPYVFGDDYIIKATDFTKSVSAVTDTSDEAIMTAANVEIYDIVTGLPATPEVTVDNGGYKQAEGLYDLVFTVTSDAKATTDAKATVTGGSAPTIEGVDFADIDQGSTFDPMAGVTATDNEDGDITGDVVVTGTVDTSVDGLQTITYEVTDSDLNTVTVDRTVLVNDGTYVVGYTYVLKASNWAEHVNDVKRNSNLKDETHGDVKVFEKATGLETNSVTVTVDDGGYTNVVGEYDVEFSVVGDDLASKSVIGLVYEGVRVGNLIINASSFKVDTVEAKTINQNNLDTYTKVDAKKITPTELVDITSDVELNNASVASLANVTAGRVGMHPLTYSVTDTGATTRAGEVASITVYATVTDKDTVENEDSLLTAKGFSTFVKDINGAANLKQFIIDNGEIKAWNKLDGSVITDIDVNTSDFGTGNISSGIYSSKITVTNPTTGSKLTKTIDIAVYPDGYEPLGEFPNVFGDNVVISSGDTYMPSLHNAWAFDDQDMTRLDVKITGEVNTQVEGFYPVKISATDSDGNTTTIDRYVLVNNGSYVVFHDYIIHVVDFTINSGSVKGTREELLEKAEVRLYDARDGKELDLSLVEIVNNGGYTNKGGSYKVELGIKDTDHRVVFTATVTQDAPLIQTGFVNYILVTFLLALFLFAIRRRVNRNN